MVNGRRDSRGAHRAGPGPGVVHRAGLGLYGQGMSTFEPAERRWTNTSGQLRSSVHARSSDALKELDLNGRPTVRLEYYRDELWLVDTDELLVNPDAKGLAVQGIYGAALRGVSALPADLGEFAPGSAVELVRAPEGAHDPNAIGIRGVGSDAVAGYLPPQLANPISDLFDQGQELSAICLQGAPAGQTTEKISVLVADPDLLAHLARNL